MKLSIRWGLMGGCVHLYVFDVPQIEKVKWSWECEAIDLCIKQYEQASVRILGAYL